MTILQNNNSQDISFASQSSYFEHFQGTTTRKTITVSQPGEYSYIAIVQYATVDLDIAIHASQAHLTIIILTTSQLDQPSTVTSTASIHNSDSSCHMRLRSLAANQGHITIHSTMQIAPNVSKTQVSLQQENIMLGDHARIHTTPALDIRSHDVQASHGAKIERLDAAKAFYLQSKGLSADQSALLMVEGYIHQLYQLIPLAPDQQAQMTQSILTGLHLYHDAGIGL